VARAYSGDEGPEGKRAAWRGAPQEEPESPGAQELTLRVQELLEAMNSAACEMNGLERRADETQTRCKRQLEQWRALRRDLRARHGPPFDKAGLLLLAAQRKRAAAARLERAARRFSMASALHRTEIDAEGGDGPCVRTAALLDAERERREAEYRRALCECLTARDDWVSLRAQIGDTALRRMLPDLRALRKRRLELVAEHHQIAALAEGASGSRRTYRESMGELERMSNEVHCKRLAAAGSC